MNSGRRRFLTSLTPLAAAGCALRARPAGAVERAADWLWDQQAADGGWHSRTYGLLKSGHSLTPLALGALLDAPERRERGIQRAIAFILASVDKQGAVGMKDPVVPDYPNYATSLAVLALVKARRRNWQSDISPMIEHLCGQQFAEHNGWQPDHPAYGAWGMGGPRRTPPDTGHVDLSMTRHVLQALRAGGVRESEPVIRKARVFLDRCQNSDGGFFFSTVVLDANKAGEREGRFRSYGSATADGLLALRAVQPFTDDGRQGAAQQWLTARHRPDAVSGFSGPRDRFSAGLRFYYAAATREAGVVLPLGLPLPRPDGSWSNPEDLVKEDDPIIATAFAIRALTHTSHGAARTTLVG